MEVGGAPNSGLSANPGDSSCLEGVLSTCPWTLQLTCLLTAPRQQGPSTASALFLQDMVRKMVCLWSCRVTDLLINPRTQHVPLELKLGAPSLTAAPECHGCSGKGGVPPSGVYSQLAVPWFLTNTRLHLQNHALPSWDEFPAAAATGDHKRSGLTPYKFRDYSGAPVVKNIPCLAMHGMQVRSLVRELGSHRPQGG